MAEATREVIDYSKLGKKGCPRFPEAFGGPMPTKIVPVDDVTDPDKPGLDPVDVYRIEIQAMIDAKAKERQYDSGATLASYVNSTVPAWAAEAQAFVAWRDQVWAYALGELQKVQSGEREQPSVEDFLAEMPAFEW